MKENKPPQISKSKRDFIKKLAIGTAFAVPVLKSFSMEGVKARSLYAAKASF